MNRTAVAGLMLLLLANQATSRAEDRQGSPSDTIAVVHLIKLKDGSEFRGAIVDSTKDSLWVVTGSGLRLAFSRSSVGSMEELPGSIVNGHYIRRDPNGARLFFAPTGRGLKAGQGYISDAELFFPYFAIGIADFLSIGGGVSIFPGASSQLFYVAPKISFTIPHSQVSLGTGVFYTNIVGDFSSSSSGVGLLYAVGTFGSTEGGVSAGVAKGFANGEFSESPIFLLGGEIQASNSVKFITENWLLPGSDFDLLSFGVRFFGDHLSADFAFVYIANTGDHEGFPFIPWISFAYGFGN